MIRLRQTDRTNDRPRNEQDVIVRINAFHANIDVNDNKQLFWF
jgi:hypothetical protein